MKRLITWSLQGLLFVAPLFVTGYIVYKLFVSIDGLFSTYIEEYFGYNIPGLGILLMFFSLVLLGIIGGTILGRPIKRFINKVLEKLPFFKLIYTSVNDLFQLLSVKKENSTVPYWYCLTRKIIFGKLVLLRRIHRLILVLKALLLFIFHIPMPCQEKYFLYLLRA